MAEIRSFNGYLVNSERATSVVSPAYDSVSPAQRRAFAEAHPDNYLNTMRLMEDFPPESIPTQEELLQINKANLDRLLQSGSFERIEKPCLFLYQLQSGEHVQTGVVCEVGVHEYEIGNLRKHENTRSDKEDLLAQYQVVVGVSSSPICLTYAQDAAIDQFVNRILANPPQLEFESEDGVVQRVWCIEKESEQQEMAALFRSVDVTYLTDGHHRAASGRRYAEIMREKHGNNGDEPYNQLLVALFPDYQLNLLPFHRCVRDTNGLTLEQIVERLDECFEVSRVDSADGFESTGHGEFGMFIHDQWYQLKVRPECVDPEDPVASLDVVVLQERILDPILGIRDMRSDSRLDYIAGVSGIEGIRQKCREGWEIVFLCHATSIDQLMDVADAGALMPPKSTYFDPKPRSGIFVREK